MASSIHYFSGKCKWAKVFKPDERYNKFSIDVALTGKQLEEFNKLGLRGKPKIDEEGNHWVTFRRDPASQVYKSGERVPAGPPSVSDPDGNSFSGIIGNGSDVTVKIQVYSWENKQYGKGMGSRLEAVRVDNLVEYKRDDGIKHPF